MHTKEGMFADGNMSGCDLQARREPDKRAVEHAGVSYANHSHRCLYSGTDSDDSGDASPQDPGLSLQHPKGVCYASLLYSFGWLSHLVLICCMALPFSCCLPCFVRDAQTLCNHKPYTHL